MESATVNAVVPLESNPEIFTKFASDLGLSPLLAFCDIYSLDDPDLLCFLPRPMQAVILLFPVTQKYEEFKNKEQVEPVDYSKVIWMKQVVKNACGLYALLHALLNIPKGFMVQNSELSKLRLNLLEHTKDPAELVQSIAKTMYSTYSTQGQTEAPPAEDNVDLHFVCFVEKNGAIYELDGRREGPLLLKSTNETGSDLLSDSVVSERVKKYMSLVEGDNSLQFALMGLAPRMD